MLDKNAIIEMIKEGLRLAFFAALTALVGYVSQQVGALDPTSTFYVIGTVVLRLVDKYIHKAPVAAKGISPI